MIEDELKNLSLRFIKQVKRKVDLTKFNESEWFKGAYSTIQKTIPGGLSYGERNHFRNILFRSINDLKTNTTDKENYNKWFDNLISKLKEEIRPSSGRCLSFGQGQKIINVLMKYHFCYYYSDYDKNWKEKYSWLSPFLDYFHAPIDNIVLYGLKTKYGNRGFENIKVWKYTDKKNRIFYNGVFVINGKQVRWSRLEHKTEHKTEYEKVQNFIQRIIEGSNDYRNSLHFEMKELWKTI